MMEKLTYNRWLRSLVLFIFILTIAACDGADNGSDSAYEYDDSGSLGFDITWLESDEMIRASESETPDYSCSKINIVKAMLYRNDEEDAVMTEEWPCSAGEGVISEVPADQEFILVVQGIQRESGKDDIIYHGKKEQVSVGKGQKSTVSVDAYYVGDLQIEIALDTDEIEVFAGKTIKFNINASDDSDDRDTILEMNYSSVPLIMNEEAVFDENKLTFTWPTNKNDIGTYKLTFSVSNEFFTKYASITIVINDPTGSIPALSKPTDQEVSAGETIDFQLIAEDLTGRSLSYSVTGESTDHPDFDPKTYLNKNNGIFKWRTNAADIGKYNLTFTVSNGLFEDSKSMTITILNNSPVINVTNFSNTVVQGKTISFIIEGSDFEGDSFNINVDKIDLDQYKITPLSSGTYRFDCQTTDQTTIGKHTITFIATDGASDPSYLTVNIEVTENKPPYFTKPTADQMPFKFPQGEENSFPVTAVDPENDVAKISLINKEELSGAEFENNQFSWKPDPSFPPGPYTAEFEVTDNFNTVRTQVTINVVDEIKPEIEVTTADWGTMINNKTYEINTNSIKLEGTITDNVGVNSLILKRQYSEVNEDWKLWKDIKESEKITMSNENWTYVIKDFQTEYTAIRIIASDKAGNSKTFTFYLHYLPPDETPPIVKITLPEGIGNGGTYNTSKTPIIIEGTAIDEENIVSGVSISIDSTSSPAKIESDKKVSWSTSIDVEDVSTEKNFTISVTATDEAGNTSTPISFTIHYTPVVVPIDDGGLDTGR